MRKVMRFAIDFGAVLIATVATGVFAESIFIGAAAGVFVGCYGAWSFYDGFSS